MTGGRDRGAATRHICSMTTDLYPTALLRLAANIPHLGLLDPADGLATKRSMVCGSEVTVSVRLDRAGLIGELGLEVEACALGQAAAAIFAHNAMGASLEQIVAARDGLEAMLKAGAPAPLGRFADLAALEPVRDYPRRHASTLLALKAGAMAVEQALGARDCPADRTKFGE